MLVNWTIENFKSFGQKVTLPLSPITVLVGANSSGKSTIIQSILLIKQTVQYATPDQPIALNGPLLKLGNFNDVKNVSSQGEGFRIGWDYNAHFMSSLFPNMLDENLTLRALTPYRTDVSKISWLTHFDLDPGAPKSELSLLQPSLTSCSVFAATTGPSNISHAATLEITRPATDSSEQLIGPKYAISQLAPEQYPQFYRIKYMDTETTAGVLEDHPNGKIVGAGLRHFFPYYVAVEYDKAVRRATQIADSICTLRKSIRFQREYAQLAVPQALLTIIDEWMKSNSEFFPEQKSLFDTFETTNINRIVDLVDALQNIQRRVRWHRTGPASLPSLQDLQPKIVEALTETFTSEVEIDLDRPRLIFDANLQTREYFENFVHYLGPLRDEPKPLYPLEALANPTDVGYRGEHTAAVLHLNQFNTISYVPSVNFSDAANRSSIQMNRATAPLSNAVVDWLSYMGVIEGFSIDDRGKFGHELQVRTPGIEEFHDLTNVGVGVSQVLPIVVMSLLAKPGSLLIFEQPELHLHPRVQTRLADFFISIALTGRQCLLETHSEYLVHRLRRRIAEAPGEELTQLSKLYFVEREGGLTSCRAVDITKYGAILDWPIDFFDQAQIESERILSAASSKRATEKKIRQETSHATKHST